MLTDKPDTVTLVVKTTESTNCSDLLWANPTCKASDANPPVECFQLYKNGKILSTLRDGTWIRDISEAGKHVYSCRALHFIGNMTISDSVTVSFNGLAIISVYVTNGSEILFESGYVSLYCNAPAYPEPTVTWLKLNVDGIAMVSSWLNVTNIGREEAGNYICMANNTCGKRKSSRRTIDVQFAPENASLSTNLSNMVCTGNFGGEFYLHS